MQERKVLMFSFITQQAQPDQYYLSLAGACRQTKADWASPLTRILTYQESEREQDVQVFFFGCRNMNNLFPQPHVIDVADAKYKTGRIQSNP